MARYHAWVSYKFFGSKSGLHNMQLEAGKVNGLVGELLSWCGASSRSRKVSVPVATCHACGVVRAEDELNFHVLCGRFTCDSHPTDCACG